MIEEVFDFWDIIHWQIQYSPVEKSMPIISLLYFGSEIARGRPTIPNYNSTLQQNNLPSIQLSKQPPQRLN